MARPKKPKETEMPPEDWTPTQAVDDPILNNPYEEPKEHWFYKDGVPSRVPGRRPASYWFKTKKIGTVQEGLFREEDSDLLPLVNLLREDVKRWRESGYRGATAVTKELFEWWIREDRPRRLFFCQREAVETTIYLLELVMPGRLRTTGFQKFAVDAENYELLFKGQKPKFEKIDEEFFPRLVDIPGDVDLLPLLRLGCKMATGSGKTIVMAMLIAWAFCNRGRNPQSTHFPNAVLICAPNLTVRKRLQVLVPSLPDNYYDMFDLVPTKYREALNAGKVMVENWHKFAPKSEHSEGGVSYAVVQKGEETSDAFTLDRLDDLAGRLPILVLNDEGHHCWRGKGLTEAEKKKALKDKEKEEKAALEEEEEEARVWLAGLDKINNCGLLGKDDTGRLRPGILACVDLSATPFYLANSGYPEGSPFPWLVSDFGLVDAIESGITKVPRLPVKDTSENVDEIGRPDPVYFRLWETIKKQLKEKDYITKGRPKPESIYKYADGALKMLASQWKRQFDKYKSDSDGKSFIPPVMIVVCDNTEISEIFYQRISGESEYESQDEKGKTIIKKKYDSSSILPEFSNTETLLHTIRIDSKLLKKIETEGDETKDEAALRLRELIDTVGKRGGTGEQVRCVVSVSMLTEGWDANNVTHILGVRAFGSQLLSEQVVGRGLRRMSYAPDPATGMLHAEYADVYGIPFSLIPFKGKIEGPDGPDPVYHSVYAMTERAHFELRMPNVESYVYSLRDGGITCDVSKLEPLTVDKEPNAVFVGPTRGYHDGDAPRKDGTDLVRQTREEYYSSVRPQELLFRLTRMIVDELVAGAAGGDARNLAKHQLFPEILKIVREYVNTKVTYSSGDVDVRELALERYAAMVRERVRDNILPAVASDSAQLLPVLNSFQPFTTTANVNYQTTRRVMELEKSHLNRAVLYSSWEADAIDVLEDMDAVVCYSPNDRGIGLIVPYEYEENRKNYEPDYFVRLRNKKMIMIEIKGMGGKIFNPDLVPAKSAAARKWVAAVNNLKRFGEWAYEYCEDVSKLRKMLETHCPTDGLPGGMKIVPAAEARPWENCVPLLTLRAIMQKSTKEQLAFEDLEALVGELVTWESHPKFEKGMFVARMRGNAMAPDIPEGAYCLFQVHKSGSAQGKTVLARHNAIDDPATSGPYCVRRYKSEKINENGNTARIHLESANSEARSFVFDVKNESEAQIVAQFVEKIG